MSGSARFLGLAEAAGVAAELRAANGFPGFPPEPQAHPVSASVDRKIGDPALAKIAAGNVQTDTTTYKSGERSGGFASIIPPMIYLVLFYVVILLLGNQMLAATLEEKENRVTEMILTTINARSLILGKVISLFVVGIVQMLVFAIPTVGGYVFFRKQLNFPDFDRRRGFRTTRELADAIPGGNVTPAILENVESGRKADLSVSQLLNIARGLDVPPTILLAPMSRPGATVDLPNLSDDLAAMTAAEFDCWLSATPASSYQPRHMAERIDVTNLGSLRELGMFQRELRRLQIVHEVETTSGDADLADANAELKQRVESLSREVARLRSVLSSAGFTIERAEGS